MTDGKGDVAKELAAAVGRIPSGLFIVTARQGADETGFLASWVQQCSFVPFQVSFAVKVGRAVAGWLTPGAPFVVNNLEEDQTELIAHFGKGFALSEPAFTGLELDNSTAGAPVLADALAFLDCRVSGRCHAGDHELFIGEVVGGRVLNEGRPMVHVRKNGSHY
jgi:flavin reductase (DIM6/NTAB) family NADH-FMN oxidoreductase RutF